MHRVKYRPLALAMAANARLIEGVGANIAMQAQLGKALLTSNTEVDIAPGGETTKQAGPG